MGLGVLIIGKSGSGKSCSLRNFKDEEVSVINVINKPFPFKKEFSRIAATDDYNVIEGLLNKSKSDVIVIDDAGYLLTNNFMRGHSGKANKFDFYNDMADSFWRMIEKIQQLPKTTIVYIIMHEEQNEFGAVKPKTLGKLLDNTVCIEGLFSIVLRSLYYDGQYVFSCETDGSDVAKSPIGMFSGKHIENDLKQVDHTIREYYGYNESKIKTLGDKK